MAEKDELEKALDRLRVRHLAFRRAEPIEVREIEAMRLEILKIEATAAASGASLDPGHIAALQLRLLERAFYVLRLDHFANAPENHGWMNLFRRWARSEPFKNYYNEMKDTLSPQCRDFYEACIRRYEKTDRYTPIHHPWQRPAGDPVVGLFMDTGRTEPSAIVTGSRPGAGGVDDAKGRAGVDQPYEKDSGGPEGDSGSSAPNA